MEIDELVQAVQTLNAEDAFRARLTLEQWRVIAPYLARHEIRAGDLLIKQGDADRSMYFIAQGSMQVFVTGGPPGSNKVAILRAGSVVGEPGLFGDTPRMANVEAMTPCVVWALRGPRMEELAQRSPALALELLRAAGAVMAVRMRATLTPPGAGHLSGRAAGRRARRAAFTPSAAASPRPARAARAGPTAPACRRRPAPARRPAAATAPEARRTDTTLTPTACKRLLAERLADAGAVRRQRHAEQPRVLQLVDGVVVGAVEVAAQQAVARVALLLHDAQHAPHRHADQRQRMAGQHQRAFDRLRHDLGRAGGAQPLEVGVVDRAHDHRHLRRMACCTRCRIFSADGVSW